MKRSLVALAGFVLALSSVALVVQSTRTAEAYPILVPGQGVAQGAGYPGWGADTTISVTGTATTSGSAALSAGFYVAYCTTDTHADQGDTGVVATTSERIIPAGVLYPVKVTGNGDTYISWIRNATSGTCYLSKDVYE